MQCSLQLSPPLWMAQGGPPAQDIIWTSPCPCLPRHQTRGTYLQREGEHRMALGLGFRSCMLYTVQVQQPGTCPSTAPDWAHPALHGMGPDFHECPRETHVPMPIHVNLNQPLQAACAALETSLHDQPKGNQRLAARTSWFTCLPEGGRRWGTVPPCHSLHAPL